MKRFLHICSLALLFMGGVAFVSCDNTDDPMSQTTQAVKPAFDKKTGTGPVTNAGPGGASYKLIFENLSGASMEVYDIFTKGINTTPGYTNFVHFKGSSTTSFTVGAGNTVTFNNYTSASPSTYNIPQWRIEYSTIVQNQDFLDTAANALANYGIQIPQGAPGAKYSYWYGAKVNMIGYSTYNGNINGFNAQYLGRASFGSVYDQTISCAGGGNEIILTWTVLSNGDVKIKAINATP